jgi:hypothetical protein
MLLMFWMSLRLPSLGPKWVVRKRESSHHTVIWSSCPWDGRGDLCLVWASRNSGHGTVTERPTLGSQYSPQGNRYMLQQKSFPCCHAWQCSPHTYLTYVTVCWVVWGTVVVSVYSWVYGIKNGHRPYNFLYTISVYLMQQSLFTLQMVSGVKKGLSAYMMWMASTLLTSTKKMEAANFSKTATWWKNTGLIMTCQLTYRNIQDWKLSFIW